jgi:flagellar biosynthetic protein FliR
MAMDWSWTHLASPERAAAAAGVVARLVAAIAVGGLPLTAGTSLSVRAAVVVALALAVWPAASAAAVATDPISIAGAVAGEAVVGLGLGVAVAAVFAAAGWAGALLGSVTGLSWADDFTPEGDPQAAGIARLAWWLGLGGFLATGGHVQLVAGLIDSFRTLPVGVAARGGGFTDLVSTVAEAPAIGLALALTLAGPAVAAVLAFHVAATIAVRVGRVDPGQGLFQSLASVVLLAVLCVAADAWIGGFAALVHGPLERCLVDVRP